METLIAAVFSGLFAGAVSWGVLRAEVRHLKNSVSALHVRVDVLMMSLAQHGLIDPSAVGHLSRELI